MFETFGRIVRDNQSNLNTHLKQWPVCPPRLPLQGNYRDKVSKALDEDLNHYLNAFDHYLEEGMKPGQTKFSIAPLGLAMLKQYVQKLRFVHAADFRWAATETLKAIRDGLEAGMLFVNVEDDTCSGARLKERARQWTFS